MGEREGVRLAGMGIVHENANFHSSETDSAQKKNIHREKKSWVQKKETPVLVPPVKYT